MMKIMPQHRVGLAIVLLYLLTPAMVAQTPPNAATAETVQSIGKLSDSTEARPLVRILTQRFGPRLTGSENEHHATTWALGEMKRAGLSDVHPESWTLHRGWTRVHAYAHLTAPINRELSVASYGWSGSTQGAVTGEVVLVDGGAALTKESTQRWRHRIVLVAPVSKDIIRDVADAPVLAKWAEKAHALAVIDGIARPGAILHTGPLGYPGRETSVPFLDMPEPQRQQLERLVRQGARPKVRLNISTRFSNGRVTEENVVREIRGSQLPEEMVLLGAHLDSWDLSPGATDDGTGVAVVIAAARLIHDSGIAPSRTIRFVLFTGEEQGLLGSQAYVQRHRAEMAGLVCAFALDWGAGPISRFPLAGHPEMEAPLQQLFRTSDTFKSIEISPGFLTFTDGFSFTFAGLPGIGLEQDSPDYDRKAHSAEDALGAVDESALRFNTRVLAQTAVWLANVAKRPGTTFTQSKNEQALRPVRNTLQILGVWPYQQGSRATQANPEH